MLGVGAGNALEWYDWTAYSIFAAYFAKQFFHSEDPLAALLGKAPAGDVDTYTSAATRVIALYQHRLDEDSSSEDEARQLRKADAAERELRLAALQGQREAIFELTRRHHVSDEVSRRLVREIDLQEARYR